MQINPELGEYRVSAALEQLGIKLSPRTCGRILALNRQLYHLQMPRKSEHTKKELPFQSDYRHHYWFVDIRYLDMHKLGGEMIYCISVLDGYSRAILASAVTRRQNFEEYIAVLYAAIRKHGCPTAVVSDHGGVFRDHRAMQIYQALGIQKEEIEKRQSWQNLIETALYVMWNLENSLHNLHYVDLTLDSFGIFKSNEGQFHIISIMRRMSNYHFEQVTSWEGAKQTHRRFVEDYNHQPHWGHRKRDDNRHTPAEVLGWVTGKMRTPEQLHRIFYATRFLRFLDRFGYARFRRWRLYAEAGLARRQSVLWLYGDTLTLEYANAPLSQYTVEYQPDKKHFRRVREPRHFETPYQSPQQPLWEPEAVEWHPAQRLPDYAPRRFRKHQKSYVQSPLLDDE